MYDDDPLHQTVIYLLKYETGPPVNFHREKLQRLRFIFTARSCECVCVNGCVCSYLYYTYRVYLIPHTSRHKLDLAQAIVCHVHASY